MVLRCAIGDDLQSTLGPKSPSAPNPNQVPISEHSKILYNLTPLSLSILIYHYSSKSWGHNRTHVCVWVCVCVCAHARTCQAFAHTLLMFPRMQLPSQRYSPWYTQTFPNSFLCYHVSPLSLNRDPNVQPRAPTMKSDRCKWTLSSYITLGLGSSASLNS